MKNEMSLVISVEDLKNFLKDFKDSNYVKVSLNDFSGDYRYYNKDDMPNTVDINELKDSGVVMFNKKINGILSFDAKIENTHIPFKIVTIEEFNKL